jgi:hypothetical protein
MVALRKADLSIGGLPYFQSKIGSHDSVLASSLFWSCLRYRVAKFEPVFLGVREVRWRYASSLFSFCIAQFLHKIDGAG